METKKLAYNMREAIAATGLSRDTIIRAVNAGDLAELTPRIEGEPIKTRLFSQQELERWLHDRSRTS